MWHDLEGTLASTCPHHFSSTSTLSLKLAIPSWSEKKTASVGNQTWYTFLSADDCTNHYMTCDFAFNCTTKISKILDISETNAPIWAL